MMENRKKKLVDSVDAEDDNFYGFTLNVPFTTEKDLWEKVQEAHVHLDETENMSFVLSVRCYELSCHVISVWIFIGSIA